MVRVGESNRWSGIQRELLEEILQKLTLVDYLNCRRVCRSWRCTFDEAVAAKGRTCPPAPQFPFLILFPPYAVNIPATLSYTTLSDITQENTSYIIPSQTWRGYLNFDRIFSVQGWLVFQKLYYNKNQNYDLILFSNPISREEFELPHLPLFPGQDFTQQISVKLVFSSAPLDSSHFMVVACATLRQEGHRWMQLLAFCRVNDRKWTLIPTDESRKFTFEVFIILDQKLYAMSKFPFLSSSVTLFNLRDSNIISFERLEQSAIRPVRIDGLLHIHYSECMLGRDGDEILLVVHRVGSCQLLESKKLCDTKVFRVFKLDMCGCGWIEIDDLGDRVLLMDCARIQVFTPKEIKLTGKFSGGNCVFFCTSNFEKCDLGVFSLKDKKITRFPLSHYSQVPGRRCLWFMPSPW